MHFTTSVSYKMECMLTSRVIAAKSFHCMLEAMGEVCYFLKYGKYLSMISGHWNFGKADTSLLAKIYKRVKFLPLTYWALLTQMFWYTAAGQLNCKILFFENSFNFLHCFMNFIILSLMRTKETRKFMKTIKTYETVTLNQENEQRREIYMEYSKKNNNIGLMLTAAGLTSITIWIFVGAHTTAFNTTGDCATIDHVVLQLRYPFDPKTYHWVTVIVDVSVLLGAGLFFTYARIVTITMAMFVTAHLKIIQSYIRNLDKVSEEIARETMVSVEECRTENIKKILKMHQEVISLMKNAQEASQSIILTMFYGHVIDLPSILVQILFGDFMLRSRNIAYMIYLFIGLYLYCDSANDIIIESTALSEVDYHHTNWTTYNKRDRMYLKMMMMRAQHALRFVVVPIGEISLETFKTIIRLSYSITTFVATIYN